MQWPHAHRGRLQYKVPMHRFTWFRVGGNAEMFFIPADREDLSLFLKSHGHHPKVMIGAGSNVLIRDGGIPGIVIKLGKGFYDFSVKENTIVHIGAGLLDRVVAERCQTLGISGFEFLSNIPGTIGGGMRMNAGCQANDACQGEIGDRLLRAQVMDPAGAVHWLTSQELNYEYRHCGLSPDWIFLSGEFQGVISSPQQVAEVMTLFQKRRQETQPIQVKTGGSTFANPPGHKAWALIDQAGYRGRSRGDAQFSEKHCNFLINKGSARAEDLELLAEEARAAVFEKSHIHLCWEIVRLGSQELFSCG